MKGFSEILLIIASLLVMCLPALALDETTKELAAQSKSEDVKERLEAVPKLEERGPTLPEAEPLFIERLVDEDARVRYFSARGLGKIGRGSDDAVIGLIKLLEDEEELVRIEAVRAIGRIGPKAAKAVKPLLKAYNENDQKAFRVSVIAALGDIGHSAVDAVPFLKDIVKNHEDKWLLSSFALDALSEIGTKDAESVLIDKLGDDDYTVYQSATKGLEKIGSDEGISAMRKEKMWRSVPYAVLAFFIAFLVSRAIRPRRKTKV